jgi:wyosine [tRNA(Phe)-imidazoG37] synthetase (radical SAM superfamily)
MISILSVSIDAASKETYERLRRGGDFEKLKRNLEFFSKLKSEGSIYKLKLNFLVQTANFREIEAFYDSMLKYDPDIIHYQRLANVLNDGDDDSFHDKRIDLPQHSNHSEFVEIISRPFMSDPRIAHQFHSLQSSDFFTTPQ